MFLTPLVLTNVNIWLSSADLTGYSNKVALPVIAEALDKTTFGSGGWKERAGGLFDVTGSIEGFWEAGDTTKPDDLFWASLGGNTFPLTCVPSGGAVGDLAYLTKVFEARYDLSGQMGQLVAWAADLQGNAPVARGQVAHAVTAVTVSGTGTAVQVGAVGTAQRMYANLHVPAVTGSSPAMTVVVQSAAASSFASATTRITFTSVTAVTGQASSVVGNITDQWWRVLWTVAGTTPSLTFSTVLGVAAK